MNYAQIRSLDIANGEGIGVALFVSGCPFHCKGCFNQEAWDYNYGNTFYLETLKGLIKLADKPYIQRLSILGGEPLDPANLPGVKDVVRTFREKLPQKKIWLYSGFTYEDLFGSQLFAQKIVESVDVFVDGKFIEEQKDLQLKFRGSRNQRVIDIAAMRAAGDWDNIIRKGYEIEGDEERVKE